MNMHNGLYDSAKLNQPASKELHISKDARIGTRENSNHSKTCDFVYGDGDHSRKQSPQANIVAMNALNSIEKTRGKTKHLTPHVMLTGDEQIASSSFDFSDSAIHLRDHESLRHSQSGRGTLTTPQRAQINESNLCYNAKKEQLVREAYHASGSSSRVQSSKRLRPQN